MNNGGAKNVIMQKDNPDWLWIALHHYTNNMPLSVAVLTSETNFSWCEPPHKYIQRAQNICTLKCLWACKWLSDAVPTKVSI